MNKNFYKTIFSKARGEMIAVAENVSAAGQASTQNNKTVELEADMAVSEKSLSLKVLSFSLMLIIGTALISSPVETAQANVVADPNAAGNQRPTILNSANGTTQVNIQTPTQGGVSVNHYQQFDVNQNGVILNNSRQNTNTQLGGYIQANPWLAGGEAKVIVNQVNSSNPSHLNGYVEVGGRKADVIIANQAGINVDGGGFINTGGVTLSTANPNIQNGQVTGYNVRDGQINITGNGLDTSKTDYTQILSRAASINAGIWANELTVVTGQNDIDASQQISAIRPTTTSTGTAPKIAIDSSNLGGMYAGKINLISTEKGVGINNAGQVFASAGSIKISANGDMLNSGAVVAQHKEDANQASLEIKGTDLNNSGTLSSLGQQKLNTGNIQNSGLITTSSELNIRNQQTIQNSGELNAGRIDIETATLLNQSGKIVQTGLQDLVIDAKTLNNKNKGMIGYTEIEQETGSGTGSGSGAGGAGTEQGSGSNSTAPSTATGGGSTSSANTSIATSFAQGKIKADQIENDAGKITANGGVDLTVTDSLTNTATLNLKNFNINGDVFNNQNGELNAQKIQANVNTLNNEDGILRSNSEFNANIKQSLNNKKGQISSGKDINIHDDNRNTLTVENSDNGKILAGENLSIQGKALANTGTIAAGKDLAIAVADGLNVVADLSAGQNLTLSSQQDIRNQNKITAGKELKLSAQNIDNQKTGELQSNGRLTMTSNTLVNRGLINSNGLTHLEVAEQLENVGTGRIYGDHVAIATKNLINAEESIVNAADATQVETKAAVIAARNRLDIGAKNILNQEEALISSGGDLAIGGALDANQKAQGKADVLINSSARIEAQGNGDIAVNDLQNLNNHLEIEEYLVRQKDVNKWKNPDDPNILTVGEELSWVDVGEKSSYFYYSDGRSHRIRFGGHNYGMYQWLYTESEYDERIKNSKPGEIIIGGNLNISGDHWLNSDSQILVGGTLSGNDASLIENKETLANARIEQVGHQKQYYYGGSRKVGYNTNAYHEEEKSTHHFEQPAMVFETQSAQAQAIGQAESTNIQSVNAKDGQIKTLEDFNTKLPNSSLFNTNPNNPQYLIETDSAFTNYKKWLGSDYMLQLFNTDPQNIHKRLGDGYYEQKLINDQVAKLTGYRRLEGYQSDEDQFKALMDSGVSFAQSMNLGLGVSLSAEQIARLTSDIVWLVNETVTLPDGSQQTVLVPKVYLMVREGDLNHAGALISANVVNLNNSQGIINQGAIAGRQLVNLSANNIENSGLIQSKAIQLTAQDQIKFEGGTAKAQDYLGLSADRIELTTTTQTTGDARNGKTTVDRVAGLYVTGAQDGILAVDGKKGIDAKGAVIANSSQNGKTQLRATEGSINLSTVDIARHESYGEKSDKTHYLDHKTAEVGTTINTVGDVSILANDKVNIRQGSINSTDGKVSIYGKQGVDISEGRAVSDLDTSVYSKTKGFLSSSTSLVQKKDYTDQSVGSVISGHEVSIGSGQDLNIRGSQVVADNDVNLQAKKNINITAAQDQSENSIFVQNTTSGVFSSGGIGVTIGKIKESTDNKNQNQTVTGSTIGSLNGNTNIIAGENYQQTGSTVSAQQGDVNIVAQQVNIEAAAEQQTNDYQYEREQKGFTLAVNVPVVSAIQTTMDATKQVGQSKNDRVNAMAAANAGFDAYKAGQSLAQLKDVATGAQNLTQATDVSVTLTYGQQKETSFSHTEGTTGASSQVYAGGKTNIVATGAGEQSNINIVGSDVLGKQGTTLIADNDINIKAFEQNSLEESGNKSQGFNAGISYSSQAGFGITAGGNLGKGSGNGEETSYLNSHVGSQESQTVINSGNATNIIGGQVQGKGIELTAKELNIESLQDKATYKAKQENISGQFTIGTGGGSASISASKSNIDANYASVNEQSGIYAGDDGYQIRVQNNTDLKGAIITSTQKAEDAGKNALSTGTLTASDIKNASEYDAKGIGISAGLNLNKPKANDQNSNQQPNTVISSPGKIDEHASSQVGVTKSIGFGLDSESDSSVTQSGINTKNITITDEQGQQARTGQSVEQAKEAIYTSITTDNAKENSGALKNNFDKDKVQSEINLQVSVTQQFDANRQEAKQEINKKLDDAKQQNLEVLEKEKNNLALTDQEKEQLKAYYQTVDNYQKLGLVLDTVAAGLSAPTNSLAGIGAAALSPTASYEIGQYFKGKDAEGSAAHILAHTLLGAAVAAAGGNDALTAGLSAGGAEASAPILAQYLYGKKPSDLTADEKGTISSITGLIASGIGVSTGDIGSTVQGGQVAQNAVENNRMLNVREAQVLQTLMKNKNKNDRNKLYQAACYLVQCAEGVPKDDPNYKVLLALQEAGSKNMTEVAALKATGLYTYGNWDKVNDLRTKNDEFVTRAGGAGKIVTGGATAIGGGAAGAAMCTTGVGCAVGAPLAGVSVYGGVSTATEGRDSLFGSYQSQIGKNVLNSFNPNRKDQLSPLSQDALNGTVALAEAVLLAKVGGKLASGTKSEIKTTNKVAEVSDALWGTWGQYPKVQVQTPNGIQDFASINGRLYSEHAVARMQPSYQRYSSGIAEGTLYNTTGKPIPGITSYDGREMIRGRSISPNFVEDIIKKSTPIKQQNGNWSHKSGDLNVILSPDKKRVITIVTEKE